MNLQIALLLIGSVLIGLIYFVSRRYESNETITDAESSDTFNEEFNDDYYENSFDLESGLQEVEFEPKVDELVEPVLSMDRGYVDEDSYQQENEIQEDDSEHEDELPVDLSIQRLETESSIDTPSLEFEQTEEADEEEIEILSEQIIPVSDSEDLVSKTSESFNMGDQSNFENPDNDPEEDSPFIEELGTVVSGKKLNKVSEEGFIVEPEWEIEPPTDLLEISDEVNTIDVEEKIIDWESLTSVTERYDDQEVVEPNVEKDLIVENQNESVDNDRLYDAVKRSDKEVGVKSQTSERQDSNFDMKAQIRVEPVLEVYTDDEMANSDYEPEAQLSVQSEVYPNEEFIKPIGNTKTLNSDDGVIEERPNERAMFNYPSIEGFDKISQIDYWVKISGTRDVGRETVLAQYRESASKVGKPCRIYGIRLPDNSWCDLELESEETRYSDILITVQLVDKQGPIDASQLDRFTALVSNLSEGTGRGFSFMAPVENALLQAQSVSDFVRYYDSVFVINVRPQHSDSLDGSSILRCATQLGLEQGDNNFFVRNKSVGKKKICLYSLANMTDTGYFDFEDLRGLKTRGVTFFTKAAVNRSPGAVFAEMVDTAKAFSARIKGEAVSPSHDDLSQDDIDDIRRSIEKVAHEMEQLGMAPGSDEAMRIF